MTADTSTIPIASLSPDVPSQASRTIKATVTLIWPYSSSIRKCALLLAEPDFRLRKRRGQVRVRFEGAAARSVSENKVQIGDVVQLALSGAEWVQDQETQSMETPGRGIDYDLRYRSKLEMTLYRDDKVVATLQVHQDDPPSPSLIDASQIDVDVSETISSLRYRQRDALFDLDNSLVWSSPALLHHTPMRRDFMTDSPFEPTDDLEFSSPAKRRKISWRRDATKWRVVSRSPSPTKLASVDESNVQLAVNPFGAGTGAEVSEPRSEMSGIVSPSSSAHEKDREQLGRSLEPNIRDEMLKGSSVWHTQATELKFRSSLKLEMDTESETDGLKEAQHQSEDICSRETRETCVTPTRVNNAPFEPLEVGIGESQAIENKDDSLSSRIIQWGEAAPEPTEHNLIDVLDTCRPLEPLAQISPNQFSNHDHTENKEIYLNDPLKLINGNHDDDTAEQHLPAVGLSTFCVPDDRSDALDGPSLIEKVHRLNETDVLFEEHNSPQPLHHHLMNVDVDEGTDSEHEYSTGGQTTWEQPDATDHTDRNPSSVHQPERIDGGLGCNSASDVPLVENNEAFSDEEHDEKSYDEDEYDDEMDEEDVDDEVSSEEEYPNDEDIENEQEHARQETPVVIEILSDTDEDSEDGSSSRITTQQRSYPGVVMMQPPALHPLHTTGFASPNNHLRTSSLSQEQPATPTLVPIPSASLLMPSPFPSENVDASSSEIRQEQRNLEDIGKREHVSLSLGNTTEFDRFQTSMDSQPCNDTAQETHEGRDILESGDTATSPLDFQNDQPLLDSANLIETSLPVDYDPFSQPVSHSSELKLDGIVEDRILSPLSSPGAKSAQNNADSGNDFIVEEIEDSESTRLASLIDPGFSDSASITREPVLCEPVQASQQPRSISKEIDGPSVDITRETLQHAESRQVSRTKIEQNQLPIEAQLSQPSERARSPPVYPNLSSQLYSHSAISTQENISSFAHTGSEQVAGLQRVIQDVLPLITDVLPAVTRDNAETENDGPKSETLGETNLLTRPLTPNLGNDAGDQNYSQELPETTVEDAPDLYQNISDSTPFAAAPLDSPTRRPPSRRTRASGHIADYVPVDWGQKPEQAAKLLNQRKKPISGQVDPPSMDGASDFGFSEIFRRLEPDETLSAVPNIAMTPDPSQQADLTHEHSSTDSSKPSFALLTPEASQEVPPGLFLVETEPASEQLLQELEESLTPERLRLSESVRPERNSHEHSHASEASRSATSLPSGDNHISFNDRASNRAIAGLRTSLSYYAPLSSVPLRLNTSSESTDAYSSLDVLALIFSASKPPRRAPSGAKDYFTTFSVTDRSIFPNTMEVKIFRPWRAALPEASTGDVVLLKDFRTRGYRVKGKSKVGLVSSENSAWCIWRYDGNILDSVGKEEVKGPPIALGDGERNEVASLRVWWTESINKELSHNVESEVGDQIG